MANKETSAIVIREENLRNFIYQVRGQEVMLDSDLAGLYGVETKVFNQAVKRNIARFPNEFRFHLTAEEFDDLRCQIGTSNLRSQSVTLNTPDLRSQFVTSRENSDLRSQNATSSLRSHNAMGRVETVLKEELSA
ncbi:MAG: ORF6N domain-containing protein [Kiritimatiellales bacterium]|jgi:hypothetical protein